MNQRIHEKGVASWELLLALVVIVGITVIGYRVYSARQNPAPSSALTVSSNTTAPLMPTSSVAVPAAPSVSGTADLDKAAADLDSVDPSSSNNADSNMLSSQANF